MYLTVHYHCGWRQSTNALPKFWKVFPCILFRLDSTLFQNEERQILLSFVQNNQAPQRKKKRKKNKTTGQKHSTDHRYFLSQSILTKMTFSPSLSTTTNIFFRLHSTYGNFLRGPTLRRGLGTSFWTLQFWTRYYMKDLEILRRALCPPSVYLSLRHILCTWVYLRGLPPPYLHTASGQKLYRQWWRSQNEAISKPVRN